MNQLAEHVSDALLRKTSAVFTMNDRYYTVKSPKTKLVAKMLKPLSRLYVDEMKEGDDISEMLKMSVEQYPYADEVIALSIMGDKAFGVSSSLRLWRLKRKLSMASDAERSEALKQITGLIIPMDFFVYARLAMGLTGAMAKETKQE